jgi:NOL1/NOP2/sun family putative RNA methylase
MERREIADRFEAYRPLLSEREWPDMIDAFTRSIPSTMWIHPTRISPHSIVDHFAQDQHHLNALPYVPGGFSSPRPMKWGRRFEFRSGLIHLQEAASMLPPMVLQPEPGELVLDLCAAPGGKSAQLSLMMENRGTLVVNDLSFNRLRALRATQERLGLKNMVLCAQEGQNLLKGHPPCFDKVLVDAPCSCEGTLRKKGKWSYEPDDQNFKARLIATQKALLLQALKLTKAGGRVVYSTCTLDPMENEGVIDAVLNQWTHLKKMGGAHCDLELEEITIPALKTSPGIESWHGAQWSDTLKRALRVYPHQNDTGGFFIASFKLKSTVSQPRTLPAITQWAKPERYTDTKREALYSWASRTFGLDKEAWGQVSFTETNTRYVSSVSCDLILPPTRYQVAGLPTIYIRGAVPRLTTAGALEWGRLATRSVLELSSKTAVDDYYAGRVQTITTDLSTGVCIPLFLGHPLGLGYLSTDQKKSSKHLTSEYPKRLRLAEGCSAFETPEQAERT